MIHECESMSMVAGKWLWIDRVLVNPRIPYLEVVLKGNAGIFGWIGFSRCCWPNLVILKQLISVVCWHALSMFKDEMKPSEPVLFIASPGADPSQELSDFAERTVGRAHFHEVAMGQGQGALAIDLLRTCARSGKSQCACLCSCVYLDMISLP